MRVISERYEAVLKCFSLEFGKDKHIRYHASLKPNVIDLICLRSIHFQKTASYWIPHLSDHTKLLIM